MPLVSSGVEHGNLRELALARLDDWGSKCRDIRTREVGIQEIHRRVRPYEVSLHTECFVEFTQFVTVFGVMLPVRATFLIALYQFVLNLL